MYQRRRVRLVCWFGAEGVAVFSTCWGRLSRLAPRVDLVASTRQRRFRPARFARAWLSVLQHATYCQSLGAPPGHRGRTVLVRTTPNTDRRRRVPRPSPREGSGGISVKPLRQLLLRPNRVL